MQRPGTALRLWRAAVNPPVTALLRSPLHPLLSGALALLTYTGRRTGALHTIPVTYAERDGSLVVLVGRPEEKAWWRNLGEPQPVSIRLRGVERAGIARVLPPGSAELAEALRVYRARHPRAVDSPVAVAIDLG